MIKKSLFTLLFSSWIFGISLICLFPPVPDYHSPDHNSGYLSQDAFPEIHQRNVSQTGLVELDLELDYFDSLVEFRGDYDLRFIFGIDSQSPFTEISTFFNTWILFKAFFETW